MRSQRSTQAAEPCRFVFNCLDRQRTRRKAHFAGQAMRNHMDGAKVGLPLHCPRHLRDSRLGARQYDCLDIWPETGQQRIGIRDGGVYEGDFVRVRHDDSRASGLVHLWLGLRTGRRDRMAGIPIVAAQ